MRLDKFIANNSPASRSDVRRLVKAQAITVNGSLARDAGMAVSPTDHVLLNDEPVIPTGRRYYMLHKPAGYVCANQHSEHPTVLDILQQAGVSATELRELQIAGRLDLDTTGLVLITNDGQWNHYLTSPNTGCNKVYRVTLAEPFAQRSLTAFTNGMLLENEKKPTLPAEVEVVTDHEVLLTIQEGKYHQVKRMFAATGNHVVALHRASVGNIRLDPHLEPGQFRPLSEQEIAGVNGYRAKPGTP